MLEAIKHITDDNFFFQEDSTLVHCVCNTIQLSENVIFALPRSIHVCQSYSKQKVGHFLRHGVHIPPHLKHITTLLCETSVLKYRKLHCITNV